MATIEPRLMHLLNDSQSPDLPSIQLLNNSASTSDSLSLPPIESDTGGPRGDKSGPQQIPPLHSIADDLPLRPGARPDGPYATEAASTSGSAALPVSQLLDEPDTHPLRALLAAYPADSNDDAATKKRQRAMTVHQDFVQLPQPLKKRKSTQQVVPPIINGLHEPPQDAAVLPPIQFDDDDGAAASNSNALKEFPVMQIDRPVPAPEPDAPDEPKKQNRGRAKRRVGKKRRKWSEEETNHLLLGVNKHGVGKWTSILEDPEYSFNDRTAGDLKDRFRTCCPAELREQLSRRDSGSEKPITGMTLKSQKSGPLETLQVDDEDLGEQRKGPSSVASNNHDSDSPGPKPRKSRAHRKNIEDLEELGIHGPFKRSERRERRPFTEQDDKDILDGLREYGPAWTKIQRDTRFNLSTRRPTDLRDRVRNKYPDIYASIEKGSFQSIQLGRGTTKILEPSVNTSIATSLDGTFEPHVHRSASKEVMSTKSTLPSSGMMESQESLPGISSFDLAEGPFSTLMTSGEEMSISRLMIEDPQPVNDYGTPVIHDGRSATGTLGGRATQRKPTKTVPQSGDPPKSPGRLGAYHSNNYDQYW